LPFGVQFFLLRFKYAAWNIGGLGENKEGDTILNESNELILPQNLG
jgi:hypothetical protein